MEYLTLHSWIFQHRVREAAGGGNPRVKLGMRSGNAAVRERGAVVIPPHCPSCRAPVTLACPNLTEALIVCSNEAVRPLPCVLATPVPPMCHNLCCCAARTVSLAMGRHQ